MIKLINFIKLYVKHTYKMCTCVCVYISIYMCVCVYVCMYVLGPYKISIRSLIKNAQ